MTVPGKRPRRRLWWILGIAGVLVLGLIGAAAAAVALQPSAAPLALPAAGAPPSGPPAERWQIAPGSQAGFRVEQTFLGATSEVTGRTEGVSGTMTVRSDRIDTLDARIDLRTMTDRGKATAPQFGASLETARFPVATVRLTGPVALDDAFRSGAAARLTATGDLTLRGVTRPVTAPVTVRRDDAGIAVVGAVPVRFADFGIAEPTGYGSLGSLADHGVAEFLLLLRPAPAT